jgi:uncharacterized protein (TIGR00725 family)
VAAYVAVVGPGDASPTELEAAELIGRGIAQRGDVLVCGGLGGVMAAACRGAAQVGGTTVGILPGTDRTAGNEWLTVAIPTGLGELRNGLVVRAADAVIAIGGGPRSIAAAPGGGALGSIAAAPGGGALGSIAAAPGGGALGSIAAAPGGGALGSIAAAPGGGALGTLSEIALALKTGVPVIGLETWDIEGVERVDSPEAAVERATARAGS